MTRKVSEDIAITLVADQLAELLSRGYNTTQLGRLFDFNKLSSNLHDAIRQGLVADGIKPCKIKVGFSGHTQGQLCIVNLVYELDKSSAALRLFSFSGSVGNKNRLVYVKQPDQLPHASRLADWVSKQHSIKPINSQSGKPFRR